MAKILHISSGLGQGGTERFLHNLMSFTNHKEHHHIIVSLTGEEYYGSLLRKLRVKVILYDLKREDNLLSTVLTLRKLVKEENIDAIQGWMYHGSLVASLVGVGKTPVLWSVRQSMNTTGLSIFTKLLIHSLGFISWHPQVIIYNSNRSAESHQSHLYSRKRSRIIPNGFDTVLFKHRQGAYKELRKELNINIKTKLIGMVARYHPMKGHLNFLIAAKTILLSFPQVQFVLIGNNMVGNQELKLLLCDLGIKKKVHILGIRPDIPWVNSALDIATLASRTEAFPNALAEYMLCETPCVSTDVGDASLILNGFGEIVQPEDPAALSQAWLNIFRLSETEIKKQVREGRKSIIEHYSIEHIVQQYEDLYVQFGID